MMKNKICLALDVDSYDKAMCLIDATKESVGMYKIGMQLFTKEGPDIVRRIKQLDRKVFLDLKFHDIPTTVANAGIEATRLGVDVFNVHALGGSAMMSLTMEAVQEEAARLKIKRPKVIAVTVLTSINNDALKDDLFVNMDLRQYVRHLARSAYICGLDGVVCSPNELSLLKQAIAEPDFIYITPGVRPIGSDTNEQQRVATPRQAIEDGATYIVIGRPITHAPDPARAAYDIVQELNTIVSA